MHGLFPPPSPSHRSPPPSFHYTSRSMGKPLTSAGASRVRDGSRAATHKGRALSAKQQTSMSYIEQFEQELIAKLNAQGGQRSGRSLGFRESLGKLPSTASPPARKGPRSFARERAAKTVLLPKPSKSHGFIISQLNHHDELQSSSCRRSAEVQLGNIVMTAEAFRRLSVEDISAALARHARGDWGEVCTEDRDGTNRPSVKPVASFSISRPQGRGILDYHRGRPERDDRASARRLLAT